ncbi:MAG: rubrerythrin, partial [Armatimonadetes bacterium]|nr:rubrerythrin [Armatimonadota bacterium]
MQKRFRDLTEQEILALAIASEEEDSRVYSDAAEAVRADYPATADLLEAMAEEEVGHARALPHQYQRRFGDHIPLIRRQDVKGFVQRKPIWMIRTKGIKAIREMAEFMELETRRFYESAAATLDDLSTRRLLLDLAEAERKHSNLAVELQEKHVPESVQAEEAEAERRLFVMQVIQPGLAGLMDGSVSTLAPLFAAAFATQSSLDALKVGIAASVGAGISMGFAEALSDDGSMTGRGKPYLRGIVCGVLTMLGGFGHTVPYFIPDFKTATAVAVVVVALELLAISWIRKKYMDTPFLAA